MTNDIPKKILLVEDDDVDVRVVHRMIGEWSDEIAIQTVSLVSEAVVAVAEQTYDCVLLDFNLPDETGLDFLRHCRTAQGHQPWPVVLLSGSSDSEQIVGAIKLGAKDYLLKDKLLESRVLQSRMIMAISEWSIERDKDQFDRFFEARLIRDELGQTPNYDALLEEMASIRAKYYSLLEKFNQSVARGSQSAHQNANLVGKLMEYERLVRMLRVESFRSKII